MFLGANHLVGTVLSRGSLPASIIVIPWRELPGHDISFTDVLDYSTIFVLPAHNPTHKIAHWNTLPWLDANIFSEHNTTRYDNAPQGVPFFDAGRELPIMMMGLTITPAEDGDYEDLRHTDGWAHINVFSTQLRLVIPGRTLIAHVAVLDANSSGSKTMRVVPWCACGDDTRIWDGQGAEVLVYGSRLFLWEQTSDWRSNKAVIYDFDSPQSMVRDIRSGDKTRLDDIVVKSSPPYFPISFRRDLRERMVTNAPYRRLETNLEGPGCNRCILFGENCFVLKEPMSNR